MPYQHLQIRDNDDDGEEDDAEVEDQIKARTKHRMMAHSLDGPLKISQRFRSSLILFCFSPFIHFFYQFYYSLLLPVSGE